MKRNRAHGFTLIELSIVLVVIGLVVGGVLVGRDLIESARMMATVSDIQKVQAAVNTFKVKYNGVPGDFPQASLMLAADAIDGDGNGNFNSTIGSSVEGYNFWHHLSVSGLIAGKNLPVTDATAIATFGGTNSPVIRKISPSFAYESRGGMAFTVTNIMPVQYVLFYPSGTVYYQVEDVGNKLFISGSSEFQTGILLGTGPVNPMPWGITPWEASYIDTKLDDGNPLYGRVYTYDNPSNNATPCVFGSTKQYAVNVTEKRCYIFYGKL